MRSDVVVTMFNPTEKAVLCLESLAENRQGVNRIIVLDNASWDTDYLCDAAEYADVLVTIRRQISLSALWNVGMQIAQTETVVLSNDDIVFAPGWLNPLQAAVHRDPTIGVIQPFNTLQGIPEDFPHNYVKQRRVDAIPSSNFIGCCFLVNKALYPALKEFDRARWDDADEYTYFWGPFPFGVEDQDFYRRVRAIGFKTRTAFDAYVHHWTGESMKRLETFEEVKTRAEELYHQRWSERTVGSPR